MNIEKLFSEFPYIETEELIIRKTKVEEFEEWYSLETSNEFTPRKSYKLSKDAAYNMLSKHYDRDFAKRKVIFLGLYSKCEQNRLVGRIEIFDVNAKIDMVTIGYTLGTQFCGKGIATKAVNALINYLFIEIGVNRIQAFVMPKNTKSGAVLIRNNFVKEGTIRQGNYWIGQGVIDLELYSILKEEYQAK